jgi:hypothetical protein
VVPAAGKTELASSMGTNDSVFPPTTMKHNDFGAKGRNDSVFSTRTTSESMFPPKPEMENFGKDLGPAGQPDPASRAGPPSKPEGVVPAKKYKTAPAVVMLDHQPNRPNPPAVRMVNSKRITINYEVKDVGPSGISGVELWCTQDGKTWTKRDTSHQARPPYVVEVEEEGLYGFTLLARNGIGLGQEAPKSGDLPQIWVEVDMTSPVVRLTAVNASCTGNQQNVIIHWKASDKNLGPRPITLSYAESEEGPWQVIAANALNTGRYVWSLPAELPARFLVRVEATDLVGNSGSSQTPKPVLMDRSQPVVNILDVDAQSK